MNLTSFWMQSGWFKALGWTFVHSLWQIAVIGLLLYITLRLIPGRKANIRYSISTMAIWMIVITALCTFIIMLPETKTIKELSGLVVLAKSADTLSLRDKISIWLESRMPMMLTVWLGGVMFLMIRLAFSLGWVRHMRNTARFSGDIQEKLDAIIKRINVKIKVTTSESGHVNSPVTIGHLKPLILFPIGIINQLTPGEVEAILTHELAHIVRRDYLSNLIQSFIETLFYYHPVTWWISRMVRSERENRADDLAVSWCGDHLSYAKALMTVEEMQLQQPASLALGFASDKGAMLARIQRILHIPYKNHNQMEKTVLLSLCSLCFLAFTFTNPAKQESPKEEKTAYLEKTLILDTHTDTIPSQGTYRIHKKTDDQDITIEVEDGDIKELKIDGKEIQPADFEDYDEVISELFGEMDTPSADESMFFEMPSMPSMPPMPEMPPMPSMPPMPDMPPMPPFYAMPHMAPLTEMEMEGMYKNGCKIGSLKTADGDHFKMFYDTTGHAYTKIMIFQNGDTSVIMSPGTTGHHMLPGFELSEEKIMGFHMPAMEMEKYIQSDEWQEYAEELKEQGKVWQEHAEEWKKSWKENGQLFEFELHGEQERLNEELGRLNEYQLRFSEDLRDNHGEWQEQHHQLMNELREEKELHGHLYALRPSRMSMSDALVEDGLIEPGEVAEIQLTPDKLKINGKKMDADTHLKYLQMYEIQQGVELSGNSRVEFKTKSRRSM